MSLSPYQNLVLMAASSVDWIPRYDVIPQGVWRSLVNKGLLAPHRGGYEITARGRDLLAEEK